MIKTFETVGREYFKDPWAARNDYVELMMDRSLDAQHRFFLRHATEKAWVDRSTALMLLEMQKNALFMYTSCGWFFDEVSGLETVQIMQYAARALELNRVITGNDLEPEFVAKLALAPSNIKEIKNGAVAYERYVKPQAMPMEKIALMHIVTRLADETVNPNRAYECEVLSYEPKKLTAQDVSLCYGSITLKSTVTLAEKNMPFAVFRRGAAEFVCAAGDKGDRNALFARIEELFSTADYEGLAAFLRENFAQHYPLISMVPDVRRKVTDVTLRAMDEQTDKEFTRIFETQYPIVRGLQLIGAPIPKTFLSVAEFVLSADLKAEFRASDININALEELMEDVKTLGIDVYGGAVKDAVTEKLTFLAFSFARKPQDTAAALKLVEFLNYADIFGFKPDTVKAQEFVFFGLQALGEEAKKKDILRALARKLKIAL